MGMEDVAAHHPAEADGPSPATDHLLDAIDLDRAANAVDMRLARLLAVLRRMDLAPLGYSSFRAFCAAEVEWHDTRIRQFIRLVESPLASVRAAVVDGRLAPSVALRALPLLDADSEGAWLADALAGGLIRPPREHRVEHEFTDDDARTIHAARTLARLHLGQPVPDATADRYILTTWRARTPRERMLADASESPPTPCALPAWSGPDPADAVVGPWQAPHDAHHGVALLRMVTAARVDRVCQMGRLLALIAQDRLYVIAGFATFETWVRRHLSVDVRTVQRYRSAAERPDGLGPARGAFVDAVATEDTVEEWRMIAPRVPRAELARVVVLARHGAESVLRTVYTDAIAEVDALLADEATKGATPLPRMISLAATLPAAPPARAARAHPDLPEAARWFLANGHPGPQRGIGRIKERDSYTCANPECAARSLRAEVHHRVFRSRGGSDDDGNLHTLCMPCHLRLVHSGHLDMGQRGRFLVFTFRDRQIWMAGRRI